MTAILGIQALAQTPTNLTVKGTIGINFNSRTTKGALDVYTISVNVANSALFQGTITDRPQLIDGWVTKKVTQSRQLTYDINTDVVNPKNPAQTKNVGKMIGVVPIDSDGVYQYDKGTLEVSILPMGSAGGFTSKFGGVAAGKPLVRPPNFWQSVTPTSVNRLINGKPTTFLLKRYDRMEFKNHVLAAGPVAIYSSVTVNGEMLYDYDKECWFVNNITMQYAENNTIKIDRLTGTIRWDKKGNEYQFDVRFNEKPLSSTAVFEETPSDESSLWETDTTVPALVGTWTYKDTKRGDITTASSVTLGMTGNNITKQQLLAATKMWVFSAVVPINAD